MLDPNIFMNSNLLLLLIAIWTLPWTGVALWKAARNNHMKWFIALLILQTLAVLEILYIFVFSKRSDGDTGNGVDMNNDIPEEIVRS